MLIKIQTKRKCLLKIVKVISIKGALYCRLDMCVNIPFIKQKKEI